MSLSDKIVNVGLVAGTAVTLYSVCKRKSGEVSSAQIRELAENEIPEEIEDSCIDLLGKYEDARRSADKVRKADAMIRKQEKIAIGYETAKNNEKNAEAAFNAAKKALKNFKPDSTQVAVGSGDSAVAINVQNSGAKVALETAVREAQSKYDIMRAKRELLDDTINQKVISSRTPEQIDILNKESAIYWDYKKALDKREQAITDICNNSEWKQEKISKIFKANVTKGEIIADAVGYSALPVAALAWIWNNAVKKIEMLEG